MLDLLTDLMSAAEGRCAYAEARHVDSRDEAIAVLNGRIDAIDSSASEGIGVRVRVGGGWGFAATRDVTRAGAQAALARALAVAESQPATAATPLAPVTPGPRALGLALRARPVRRRAGGQARAALRRRARPCAPATSASSARSPPAAHGASARPSPRPRARPAPRRRVASGAGIAAYATDGSDLQVRSYPTAHGGGLTAAAGWEHVRGLDLAGHAPRVAEEAIALLSAPPCPQGTSTIVLHGEQVALQVHESIGHALELDRILLGEASYAGTSWVAPGDLGSLRYGSELVHVTADATLPGGLGSFGWDDEGVAAARADLVEGGVLRAALSNRESAAAVGLGASGGCARADGFARQPIVRMTNVSLEPGDVPTLADLIADTDDGLYLETQPLVVDRRPPPAVPVRHRGVPRDPRRRARAAVPQRLLRRRDAALLGLARRGLRARRVAAVGPDELRQGRAGPGHGRLPRRRAGALPRRPGRGGVTRRARARRARAGLRRRRGAGHRHARALAALALRGLAPDAGHGGRRPHGLDAARPRRPHGLGGHERDDRRGAARRRRARRAPPRAPRRAPPASPATTRGCPRRRRRARTTASTPLTAQLDPAVARRALRAAFDRCAAAGLQAFGIWTAGAVETAIASSPACARATA